jgi:5-formyltetrahydrofolate cyclo-ligase
VNSIQAQKADLRTELKQGRREIPESSRQQKNLAIQQSLLSLPTIEAANSLFCFISYGTEVETHDIIGQLLSQGKQLAVPKIMNAGHMHAIVFQDWNELHRGQLGILTPHDDTAMDGPFDITITPGLGFTESGKRLGFGRGYYDKWFQANEAGVKIALAYERQILDDLPTDEFDVKVDMIITEERLIRI